MEAGETSSDEPKRHQGTGTKEVSIARCRKWCRGRMESD